MQAVADSNLTTMATLWGTAKGPAARTRQPPDYERRIAVMRSYLRNDDSRILADTPGRVRAAATPSRSRSGGPPAPGPCRSSSSSSRDGSWIVNQVDLTAAGNPARPCDPVGAGHSADRHRGREQRGNLRSPPLVILLGELEQDAGRRLRMDEGDPASAGSGARHLVDQAIAGGPAGGERGVQVRHPIADVVDAGTASRQKPGDGTVRRRAARAARPRSRRTAATRWWRRRPVPAGAARGRGRPGRRRAPRRGPARRCRHARCGGDPPSDPSGECSRSRYQPQENNIMATTNPQTVHVTDASFASEIEQANGLVLVDFWATWCGPCQIVAPILEQLAGEYAGKAKVTKVDVDANQRTAMRFNVRSIPSILFFKNGQHVDTVIGAVPKATLEGKIKQHLSLARGGAARQPPRLPRHMPGTPLRRRHPARESRGPLAARRGGAAAGRPWSRPRTPGAPGDCSAISAPRPRCSASTPTPASRRLETLLEILADGRDVALVTDAGTPASATRAPTSWRRRRAAGYHGRADPGPVRRGRPRCRPPGLPADRYLFLGFIPRKGGERARLLGACGGGGVERRPLRGAAAAGGPAARPGSGGRAPAGARWWPASSPSCTRSSGPAPWPSWRIIIRSTRRGASSRSSWKAPARPPARPTARPTRSRRPRRSWPKGSRGARWPAGSPRPWACRATTPTDW